MSYKHTIMLPTNKPNQGRYIRCKLHSLNPYGETWNNELSYRFALVSQGYRNTKELKRRIKQSLGFKAFCHRTT